MVRVGPTGRRWVLFVGGFALLSFGFGFLGVRTGLVQLPEAFVAWRQAEPTYHPSGEWGSNQLFLVYVGSAGCGWSNVEWLPAVVDSLKIVLRDRADSLGISFATLGVAPDWSPGDGVAHLNKIGAFDEIAAGYGWMNSSALRYLWSDIPGDAGTPQLVLLYREVLVPERGRGQRGFYLQRETLLHRAVGTFEIRQWLRNGVPLRRELPLP
jgi:hypothetical protein